MPKNDIIINTKAEYKCCYYNIENDKCESNNYMILIYQNEAIYKSGFSYDIDNSLKFRDNIEFLAINRKKIEKNEALYIRPNVKVEIHYSDNVLTLENYFSLNYDDNAKNIKKIELLTFISSNIKNMSHLFEGWNSLDPINLSDFDYSSVIDMSYIFSECSFESIDLSNLNTPEVENISHIFEGCSSLKEINFTNFNNGKVNDISYMFSGCSSIISIDLSILNNIPILTMDHIFEGCSSLVSINLSNLKTEDALDMSYMFSGCEHLESIDLSNLVTSSVINLSHIFEGCSALKSINLSKLKTENVEDMSYIF